MPRSGSTRRGKTAMGVRLKRARMQRLERDRCLAVLPGCRMSGRYEDFWEWSAALNTPRAVSQSRRAPWLIDPGGLR